MEENINENSKTFKKHYKFVEEYLKNGGNYAAAYSIVYGNTNKNTCSVQGSLLSRHKNVQYILKKIQDEESKYKITKDEIIGSNIEIRDLAIKAKNYASALKANEMITKLLGYNEPDKSENKQTIQFSFGDENWDDLEEKDREIL